VAANLAVAADRLAIDGMAESAEEQLANLQQAETRPHLLDLPTVDRVIRVYTEQQGDLWLYREQLARAAADGDAAGRGRAATRRARRE